MPGGAIAVASDHAGFDLKEILTRDSQKAGREVFDLGTNSEMVHFPDINRAMVDDGASGQPARGVRVCGTGGSIAANRKPKVRAALVHDVTSAKSAGDHNDANVVAFGQCRIGRETAGEALRVVFATEFDGGLPVGRVATLSKG